MKATIKWTGDVSFAGTADSGHTVVMDGAPESGGQNKGSRPMELVLIGMGGCTAYDVVHILRKSRQEITDCVAQIEAKQGYLKNHPEVEIVAECSNGFDAIKKINELKPDIIFLDIQMPKISVFEMLELLEEPPVIIFTTAFDHYAIKAFEVNAADYLLKPFSEERFNDALKKTFNFLQDKFEHDAVIKNIIDYKDEKIEYLERVVIKEGSKISIIPVETIKWIEAQDDYVMINCDQGRFLKQKTMKYFENHLNKNNFIRIHRSNIKNDNGGRP